MRVGIVGLGKLGLPVALAIQERGFDVIGTDTDERVVADIEAGRFRHQEKRAPALLAAHGLRVGPLDQVARCELVFVAVQTPHEPQYEGTTRLPAERADFDYSYLIDALAAVVKHASPRTTVAVISTVLPGTYRQWLQPIVDGRVRFVYNPFFVAMGDTIADFHNPEFVLIGHDDDPDAVRTLEEFYATIHDHRLPNVVTDVTTAEAIKVSYNTFVTMKTVLANTWGELAHRLDLNVDDIHRAWSLSTDRLLSPRYLAAGMGDGGACHPRDNIALSYLARKVGLSHDLFEDLMLAREGHAQWLASLLASQPGPVCILGRAFKPGTDLETGSAARLVANILAEWPVRFEHVAEMPAEPFDTYLIATAEPRYAEVAFPVGSLVVDPFGIVADQDGVKVVRLGRR